MSLSSNGEARSVSLTELLDAIAIRGATSSSIYSSPPLRHSEASVRLNGGSIYPPQDAIDNFGEKLRDNRHFSLHSLLPSDIIDLLSVTLNNTFFTYNGIIHQQISDLPMGCSVSGVLAIFFLDTLERRALRSFGGVTLFKGRLFCPRARRGWD